MNDLKALQVQRTTANRKEATDGLFTLPLLSLLTLLFRYFYLRIYSFFYSIFDTHVLSSYFLDFIAALRMIYCCIYGKLQLIYKNT